MKILKKCQILEFGAATTHSLDAHALYNGPHTLLRFEPQHDSYHKQKIHSYSILYAFQSTVVYVNNVTLLSDLMRRLPQYTSLS